MINIRL